MLLANQTNAYAARMSSYNFDRIAKAHVALAKDENREEYLGIALENWRTAVERFRAMKANGTLGEFDATVIAETEQEIAKTEAALKSPAP